MNLLKEENGETFVFVKARYPYADKGYTINKVKIKEIKKNIVIFEYKYKLKFDLKKIQFEKNPDNYELVTEKEYCLGQKEFVQMKIEEHEKKVESEKAKVETAQTNLNYALHELKEYQDRMEYIENVLKGE